MRALTLLLLLIAAVGLFTGHYGVTVLALIVTPFFNWAGKQLPPYEEPQGRSDEP